MDPSGLVFGSHASRPPWRIAAQAVALALGVAAAAYVALYSPRDFGQATPIWLGNALVVAVVLRGRSGQWPLWVASGFLGNLAADLAVGDSLATAVALSASNTIEVLICGLGLRRLLPLGFDPANMSHLAKGAALALAGSATSAIAAATYLGVLHGRHVLVDLAVWTLADALGLIILAPCLLILSDWRRYAAGRPVTARGVALVAVVVAMDAAIFAQTRYPLLFLAPLAALVAGMALEVLGAAIVVLATAALAVAFTLAGRGPIVLSTGGWTERLILLQVFVAVCSCLSLQMAAMHQQRRLAADALRAALAQAERAARVKAEFLANMSHEIRTPLTSILGFASLLAEKDLGDEAGRYASRVLGASRSLLALVNDVLDFSKLEAGQLEIKPGVGDPALCGRDTLELFSAQAEAKGLALRFEADALPAWLLADFDRVRQVLMNLVGNAVKFTPEGSVRVRAAYDAAGEWLRYEVIDSGPGLDADDREKLFKRFSQVDASVNRAHGGSGLGLAICKGLVEAMGGRIGVESAPAKGSTFWFEIPAPLAEPEAEAVTARFDMAALVGLKVLLVDDNAANRELIRSLLTPFGVNLTTVDGGEAAISLTDAQAFELILMDLRMPGVDGWSAARAIREAGRRNRSTPMLAFSADITADDEGALDAFQGVVRKPIEMAELLAAIARWAGATTPAPVEVVAKTPQRRR